MKSRGKVDGHDVGGPQESAAQALAAFRASADNHHDVRNRGAPTHNGKVYKTFVYLTLTEAQADMLVDPQKSLPSDSVRVRNLLLIVPISNGAQWPPKNPSLPTKQPIRLSLTIPHDVRLAAANDDVSASINYGSLSSTVLKSLDAPQFNSGFASLEALLDHIFATCFEAFDAITEMALNLVKPRASPYAEGFGIQSTRRRDGTRVGRDIWTIEELRCNLIVGLNACEREDKQAVHFNVGVSRSYDDGDAGPFDFRSLCKRLREVRRFV